MLTIVADVLWSVVIVAIVAASPGDGANIGAGFLALLALPLSIVAAGVLITTADSTAPRVASAASIALWALSVAFSWAFVGLAAILALTTSAVLVGRARRR